MPQLAEEEREFRSGRGIPLKRWWPIVGIFIAALIASLDTSMQSCVGESPGGRKSIRAILQFALTYPCSPVLLRGSWGEWLLFAGMWVPIPFGVLNLLWLKRHKAYWDRKRQRER